MTKNTFDFSRLLELSRLGISKTARIAALMGIPSSTLYRWLDEDPAFATTYAATLDAGRGQSEETLLRALWTNALEERDVPSIKLLLNRVAPIENEPSDVANLAPAHSRRFPATTVTLDSNAQVDVFLNATTERFLERRNALKQPTTPHAHMPAPGSNPSDTGSARVSGASATGTPSPAPPENVPA